MTNADIRDRLSEAERHILQAQQLLVEVHLGSVDIDVASQRRRTENDSATLVDQLHTFVTGNDAEIPRGMLSALRYRYDLLADSAESPEDAAAVDRACGVRP